MLGEQGVLIGSNMLKLEKDMVMTTRSPFAGTMAYLWSRFKINKLVVSRNQVTIRDLVLIR